jgi:ribosomal protein L11 methyltransferase
MTDYVEIQATLPAGAEERLSELLSPLPVLGVQVIEERDAWVDVGVWLEADRDWAVEEVSSVLKASGAASVSRTDHGAEDWSGAWRRKLRAFGVGRRWWIDPHPERPTEAPGDRLRLVVEPRAAFGSGTHESTRLVLEELEDLGCEGYRVLDVGTGSGVLAVAAGRLGAGSVVALDTDPIAAWEARFTADRQPTQCRPLIVAGGVECLAADFDLVLCNMILVEFSPLLGEIRRLLEPKGTLVLSGILECERDSVADCLEASGMHALGDRGLGEWICVRAGRSESRS